MTEEFLHYLWKYKLLDHDLFTTEGECISIITTGNHNFDEGPDFFNARIRIGETLWVGNIEIHINSSDWDRHSHAYNKLYDNVILHVVYKEDKKILPYNKEKFATLIIKDKFNEKLEDRYNELKKSLCWIPCEKSFRNIEKIILDSFVTKLAIERFEKKTVYIKELLKNTNNDILESFYITLARNFGFKVNSEAFEMLAKSTPAKLISKNRDVEFRTEALLFGQAGMLNRDFSDDYPRMLKKEYSYQKKIHGLEPMNQGIWKFMRTRPMNFPTIRISQFANLISNSMNILQTALHENDIEIIIKLFNCHASEYFSDHLDFDKPCERKKKSLGIEAATSLIINTVIPFHFLYASVYNNQQYVDKAIRLLETLPAENNLIIRKWSKIYQPLRSAMESQAFIELKTYYCDKKRCLDCRIGNFLLKS